MAQNNTGTTSDIESRPDQGMVLHTSTRRKNSSVMKATAAALLVLTLIVMSPFVLGAKPSGGESGGSESVTPEPEVDPAIVSAIEQSAEFGGHHYLIVDEPMYWTQANAKCGELRGHMVTVTSPEEQDFLEQYTEQNGTSMHYWLGATDASEEGNWKWVTGEPMTYKNWDNKQPNDADYVDPENGQDYMHMQCNPGKKDEGAYGTWNDICDSGVTYTKKKDYRIPPSYNDTQYFGYIIEWDSLPDYTKQ